MSDLLGCRMRTVIILLQIDTINVILMKLEFTWQIKTTRKKLTFYICGYLDMVL